MFLVWVTVTASAVDARYWMPDTGYWMLDIADL